MEKDTSNIIVGDSFFNSSLAGSFFNKINRIWNEYLISKMSERKLTLRQKQSVFAENIGRLIGFAYRKGFEITFGEAQRPEAMQLLYFYGYSVYVEGKTLKLVKTTKKSHTTKGLHPKKLAFDFNLFKAGKITYEWNDYKVLGDYWESLHPKNRWGGDWNKNDIKDGFIDSPHFEMQE